MNMLLQEGYTKSYFSKNWVFKQFCDTYGDLSAMQMSCCNMQPMLKKLISKLWYFSKKGISPFQSQHYAACMYWFARGMWNPICEFQNLVSKLFYEAMRNGLFQHHLTHRSIWIDILPICRLGDIIQQYFFKYLNKFV